MGNNSKKRYKICLKLNFIMLLKTTSILLKCQFVYAMFVMKLTRTTLLLIGFRREPFTEAIILFRVRKKK